MSTPLLVLIEWEDSHYRAGWTSNAPDVEPLICRSVGWLVSETKTALVLASNVTIEAAVQRCGDMTIPRSCVRKASVISAKAQNKLAVGQKGA